MLEKYAQMQIEFPIAMNYSLNSTSKTASTNQLLSDFPFWS